jgi:hypothetical protein
MAKVFVIYYLVHDHSETMAQAIAEGARDAGASADIKRVPETVSEAVARDAHFKVDQPAPVAAASSCIGCINLNWTSGRLPHYRVLILNYNPRFVSFRRTVGHRRASQAQEAKRIIDDRPFQVSLLSSSAAPYSIDNRYNCFLNIIHLGLLRGKAVPC